MKEILEGSALWRWVTQLAAWYEQGALAGFFRMIAAAYPDSVFCAWWKRFLSAPLCDRSNSVYGHLIGWTRKQNETVGVWIEHSFFVRLCARIWKRLSVFLGGGLVGRACRFLGVRGILLMALALYLPIDYLIRTVLAVPILSSVWDELLMLAAFAYLFWRRASKRGLLTSKVSPVEAYLLLFFGVGFFLMCVNAPDPSIALEGYRAVVEYMIWFFLAVRLIENDRDFTIFFVTMVAMGALLSLHCIYQFIVAVPIPSTWVSQSEAGVRTRVFSLTGSPNIMGSLLVLLAPMAAGIAYYAHRLWIKALALCTTGLMCLSILFTFSKGAWGGLAVAVLIFAIFLDRRLIALMGVAGAGALIFVPSVTNRITYLFTSDYVEASQRAGRMVRWETGMDLLNESNRLLGFGLGRFGGAVAMNNQVLEQTTTFSYFTLDNYYLKTLVEMGYLGLGAFILLLVGLALWSLRSIGRCAYTKKDKSRVLAVSIAAGLAGVLFHCYFENIFEVPYMTAYFWSLAACVIYLGYFRKKAPSKGKT